MTLAYSSWFFSQIAKTTSKSTAAGTLRITQRGIRGWVMLLSNLDVILFIHVHGSRFQFVTCVIFCRPAYLGSNESTKPFPDMIASHCNLWRNYDDIQCSWSSLANIIDHWGEYGHVMKTYAGPGHWNDPVCLTLGFVSLMHSTGYATNWK